MVKQSIKKILARVSLISFCVTLGFPLAEVEAETPQQLALAKYFAEVQGLFKEPLAISLIVSDLASGKTVFALNEDTPLTPASVQKLLTSLAALRMLGSAYRFPTELFLDHLPQELAEAGEQRVDFSEPPTSVGNLYIRGYGDPLADIDLLEKIVLSLKMHGVKSLKDVVLDDTLFVSPGRPSGEKPHEAAFSALTLNFNSYSVYISPTRAGLPALISLDEYVPFNLKSLVATQRGVVQRIEVEQSPSSTALQAGFAAPEREYYPEKDQLSILVKGSIGVKASPQTISRTVPDPWSYYAAVLSELLRAKGIELKGKVRRGEVSASAKSLQTMQSAELASILKEQNQSSNNIIAGQLLFAIGQERSGVFRYSTGLRRLAELLEQLGAKEGEFTLRDGSGIDRENRLSARQVNSVLIAAYQDFSLFPAFSASLAHLGFSGTLKERNLLDPKYLETLGGSELMTTKRLAAGVWAKTGTLEGVSSLAGYLESNTTERLAFSIILNGIKSKEEGVKIENNLLKILLGLPLDFVPSKVVPGVVIPERLSGRVSALPKGQASPVAPSSETSSQSTP